MMKNTRIGLDRVRVNSGKEVAADKTIRDLVVHGLDLLTEELLVEGAVVECDKGSDPQFVFLPANHGIESTAELPVLNAKDCVAGENIEPFGTCSAEGHPDYGKAAPDGSVCVCQCTPDFIGGEWQEPSERTSLGGAPAIHMNSFLICAHGGVVTPLCSGQDYVNLLTIVKDNGLDLRGLNADAISALISSLSSTALFLLPDGSAIAYRGKLYYIGGIDDGSEKFVNPSAVGYTDTQISVNVNGALFLVTWLGEGFESPNLDGHIYAGNYIAMNKNVTLNNIDKNRLFVLHGAAIAAGLPSAINTAATKYVVKLELREKANGEGVAVLTVGSTEYRDTFSDMLSRLDSTTIMFQANEDSEPVKCDVSITYGDTRMDRYSEYFGHIVRDDEGNLVIQNMVWNDDKAIAHVPASALGLDLPGNPLCEIDVTQEVIGGCIPLNEDFSIALEKVLKGK